MADFLGLAKFGEALSPMVNTMKVQELAALATIIATIETGYNSTTRSSGTVTAEALRRILLQRVREEILLLKPEKEIK